MSPLRGWEVLLLLPAAVIAAWSADLPAEWPRWVRMWALAWSIYAGCKWLTWRRTPVPGAGGARTAGYLLAWPGMDAAAFLDPGPAPPPTRPTPAEWLSAGAKIITGAAMVAVGMPMLLRGGHDLAAGWTGMWGMVLVLHFGTFALLSCAWRAAGVAARPLMERPLAAASLAEFWGRRWNTAFRDLTHRFVFRPLTAALGPSGAVAAGFLLSGVIHDVVISLPAGGGWGGPTAYFVVQGAALLFERSPPGRRAGLGRGLRGRAFTLAVLAAPLPLLFPAPFVLEVILPFLRMSCVGGGPPPGG